MTAMLNQDSRPGSDQGLTREAWLHHILGQCWARRASADGVNHIFLGPQEGDPASMLVSLLHELIHAADDCASGHKGTFAEAAIRLGFEGPMTQTRPAWSSPPKSSMTQSYSTC